MQLRALSGVAACSFSEMRFQLNASRTKLTRVFLVNDSANATTATNATFVCFEVCVKRNFLSIAYGYLVAAHKPERVLSFKVANKFPSYSKFSEL